MTISKEQFEAIVIDLVDAGDGALSNDWKSHFDFAHALIKRVEDEEKMIDENNMEFVYLPLVAEE